MDRPFTEALPTNPRFGDRKEWIDKNLFFKTAACFAPDAKNLAEEILKRIGGEQNAKG